MKRLSTFYLYDPIKHKYQYYCFYPEGRFILITMSKDINQTTESLKKYKDMFPVTMKWKLIIDGFVRIEHKDDPSQNGDWITFFADSDKSITDIVPIKHGLIGMKLTNKKQTRALVRIMEKIE